MNEGGTEFGLVVSIPEKNGFDATARASREALIDAYRAMREGHPEVLFDLIDDEVASPAPCSALASFSG